MYSHPSDLQFPKTIPLLSHLKKPLIATISALVVFACLGQSTKAPLSFALLFPPAKQQKMGLNKLNDLEKEQLRAHVEGLLLKAAASTKRAGNYGAMGGGHWVSKNIDSGEFILLEDGSLWQIDPLDKIEAMLWLATSSIVITESTDGSPGFDYLLINTDDGEKAHAKLIATR